MTSKAVTRVCGGGGVVVCGLVAWWCVEAVTGRRLRLEGEPRSWDSPRTGVRFARVDESPPRSIVRRCSTGIQIDGAAIGPLVVFVLWI